MYTYASNTYSLLDTFSESYWEVMSVWKSFAPLVVSPNDSKYTKSALYFTVAVILLLGCKNSFSKSICILNYTYRSSKVKGRVSKQQKTIESGPINLSPHTLWMEATYCEQHAIIKIRHRSIVSSDNGNVRIWAKQSNLRNLWSHYIGYIRRNHFISSFLNWIHTYTAAC